MFKLNPDPQFEAKVALSVPGMTQPLDVSMTFRHKTKLAVSAWIDALRGKDDAQILHEVIVSWAGVVDEAGAEVPYSLSALTDLLNNYAAAHGEIFRAYLRELSEAKRKNS